MSLPVCLLPEAKAEFDAAKSSRRSKNRPSDAMKDQTPPRSGE